ncbi:MAG: cupin domain-containing protein [Gemmatimonadetes bacterium]|nr:cupin domain-containing protein [Gemmatimonadota bacterium]
MGHVTNYRAHVGAREDGHFRSTLFRSERLLLGLNCLEPGQIQAEHVHNDQDKFYLVQEGRGEFAVGEERFGAGPGQVVWAPASPTSDSETYASAMGAPFEAERTVPLRSRRPIPGVVGGDSPHPDRSNPPTMIVRKAGDATRAQKRFGRGRSGSPAESFNSLPISPGLT